ncbi:MAG TPA: DUF2063 domain-containing protein, partial [Candidatus Competibacteraceae bacterium]|nr:DUF2063 domain-containing protein [Candidatus Competibacteraceae bacterium]
PAGDHDRLRLRPHPSLALLESPYPLLAIWQSNQPGAAERVIDLAEGGDRLLVCRPLLEVEIERLGAGAYRMLRALADGARVGAACALAIADESGFEPGPMLGRWLSRGVLVEAYL